MTKELSLVEHADLLDKVANLHMQRVNPTQIARQLGIKRTEVIALTNEWIEVAKNNKDLQDLATDRLHEYDASTNKVIEEAWALYAGAEEKVQAGLLKTIADVERQRVETLQKAGLYSDNSLGDQMAEMEEKAAAIKELLKQVATAHPETRMMIMQGLQKIFGQPESINISEGDGAGR